jgi:hypothetical protein
VDWFINPYITLPAGGGRFYAGIRLYADGTRIPVMYDYGKENSGVGGQPAGSLMSTSYQIKWEIPIGWNWYF